MHSADVDVDHFQLAVEVGLRKASVQTEARAVDEQGHILFLCTLVQPAAVFLAGDIADVNAAGRVQLARQLLQTVTAAGNQKQTPAARTQLARNIPPDAG